MHWKTYSVDWVLLHTFRYKHSVHLCTSQYIVATCHIDFRTISLWMAWHESHMLHRSHGLPLVKTRYKAHYWDEWVWGGLPLIHRSSRVPSCPKYESPSTNHVHCLSACSSKSVAIYELPIVTSTSSVALSKVNSVDGENTTQLHWSNYVFELKIVVLHKPSDVAIETMSLLTTMTTLISTRNALWGLSPCIWAWSYVWAKMCDHTLQL